MNKIVSLIRILDDNQLDIVLRGKGKGRSLKDRRDEAREAYMETLYSDAPRRPCAAGVVCKGASWPLDLVVRGGKATDAYCRFCKNAIRAFRAHWLRDETERIARERRARKLAVPSEPYTRQDVLDRDNERCIYCGWKVDTGDFHIAHRWPLSQGGPDVLWNVGPAHPVCNLGIGNRNK